MCTFFKSARSVVKVTANMGLRPTLALTSATLITATIVPWPIIGDIAGVAIGISMYYAIHYAAHLIDCLKKYNPDNDDDVSKKAMRTLIYSYSAYYIWRAWVKNKENDEERSFLSNNTTHLAIYHGAAAGSVIASMQVALDTTLAVDIVDIITEGLLGGGIGIIAGLVLGWIANRDFALCKFLQRMLKNLENWVVDGDKNKHIRIFYDNALKISNISFRLGGTFGSMIGLGLGGIPGAALGYLIGAILSMFIISSIFGASVVACKAIRECYTSPSPQPKKNGEGIKTQTAETTKDNANLVVSELGIDAALEIVNAL